MFGPWSSDRAFIVPSLPGTSASRVCGPEHGAHGAFHVAASNGGWAVPPHWGAGARAGSSLPHWGGAWSRLETGKSAETSPSRPRPPTASGMQLERTGHGGRARQGEVPDSEIAEAILPFVEKERGFVRY